VVDGPSPAGSREGAASEDFKAAPFRDAGNLERSDFRQAHTW
jgi:hypothetical protein